jgi:uncharacterized membrane protein
MTALTVAPMAWVGGLAIVWRFASLAFWILLIALIVLLARSLRTTAAASGEPTVRLLEEHYARGDITREEFLERRAVLRGTSPADDLQ